VQLAGIPAASHLKANTTTLRALRVPSVRIARIVMEVRGSIVTRLFLTRPTCTSQSYEFNRRRCTIKGGMPVRLYGVAMFSKERRASLPRSSLVELIRFERDRIEVKMSRVPVSG